MWINKRIAATRIVFGTMVSEPATAPPRNFGSCVHPLINTLFSYKALENGRSSANHDPCAFTNRSNHMDWGVRLYRHSMDGYLRTQTHRSGSRSSSLAQTSTPSN